MATEQGPQEAILKELSRHEPRNQQAISMEITSDKHERAAVTSAVKQGSWCCMRLYWGTGLVEVREGFSADHDALSAI